MALPLDHFIVRQFANKLTGEGDATQFPSGPAGQAVVFRMGVVAILDYTHDVALISIGGGTTNVPVMVLNGAFPVVGSTVIVGVFGQSYYLMGSINTITTAPRGVLSQVSATSSSSTTTSIVDWFTAPAFTVDGTRRVKATFTGTISATVGTADVAFLVLREGSTDLQFAQIEIPITGGGGTESVTSFWQGVPSAGSHTYKISVQANSGTLQGVAGATNPAFLLIEDIGV